MVVQLCNYSRLSVYFKQRSNTFAWYRCCCNDPEVPFPHETKWQDWAFLHSCGNF